LPATAAVAIATALNWPMFSLFAPANLIMTYLLATVLIAARYGRGPSVVACVLSVAAFDFFFVPPYFTLAVIEVQYLLTFAVMLVVSLVISGLTVRIRRQAQVAEERERRTAALYAMSRELARTSGVEDLVATAARHLGDVFAAEVAILQPNGAGRLEPGRRDGTVPAVDADVALARAAFEQGRAVGLGTATSSAAGALALPLLGHRGPLGAVIVRPRYASRLGREPLRQLEPFVDQTALALERARLAAEAEDARVGAESERLRNALLTSVSHDLRTPLAAITGAATTILETGGRLDARTQHELLESVREEADRLNRLVQNLLEMTRLESGPPQLRREWHPLEEVVGAALGRLGTRLGTRRVDVSMPADLPLVPIDDVLIEQVFVNLLENAVKYTPADCPLRIIATASDRQVTVEVADHGPGLPRGDETRVFEKFYRAGDSRGGAGLGLAICRGIVQAHGGRIWAQNLPEGGVAFLFTLPLPETRPPAVPVDA
jgi:two-component system sensor histidine kinase KdpD